MDIAALKDELRELEDQYNELGMKRQQLRQKIAEGQAVFKVGDRITYDGADAVWQITAITPDWQNAPRYIGAKLKKDGKPQARTGTIYTNWGSKLRLAA